MNDEYNKLLAKAVKATCGPSDLEQEAREVLDETGLGPREIHNELVILRERYTNQVGITERRITDLEAALKAAQEALTGITCNCVEGPEIFSRQVLMESIEKEASKAWRIVTDALSGEVADSGAGEEYIVGLHGCDDETVFGVVLTKQQAELLAQISRRSRDVATYGCMPIMTIKTANTRRMSSGREERRE